MAAAARRDRRSATATDFEDLPGAIETEIPAALALDDRAGVLVSAIQKRQRIYAYMIYAFRIRGMRLKAVVERFGRIEFFKDRPHDDAEVASRLKSYHEPFKEGHFFTSSREALPQL